MHELEERLRALEKALAAGSAAEPEAERDAAAAARRRDDVEARVGAYWLSRLGIVALITGVAFLDRFPASRGHAMVIPRAHAATLLELDDAAVGDLFLAVKATARKIAAALGPRAFNYGWNQGAAAGQHVFHLHVHVIPRYAEGGRGAQSVGDGSGAGASLAEVAEAIRRAS